MNALYEILVPTQTNEGKPIRTRQHREWDTRVRRISGGLTVLTPAKGQWVSPDGVLFKERMIPVGIMCTAEEIEDIAFMTAMFYQQQAVMFYRVSDDVRIERYAYDEHGCLRPAHGRHQVPSRKEVYAQLKQHSNELKLGLHNDED